MVAQFMLGLSIIVGIHELGHLLFAKLFGMRVESYMIGYPPKLLKLFQWGETEYSLGALPFGGAVIISGMVDESLNTEALKAPPQPWEFRAKPAWQRLFVMLGGIFFNVITGIVIYTMLALVIGDVYLSRDEVNKHGIVPNAMGFEMGFQEGDKIIQINGRDFHNFAEVLSARTLLSTNGYYTVQRGDQTLRIDIPASLIEDLSSSKRAMAFVEPRVPFAVEAVQAQSNAAQAGLQPGDQIVSVSGVSTPYMHQLLHVLAANADKKVTLQLLRQGQMQEVQAHVDSTGKLGFRPAMLLAHERRSYGLGKAIAVGSYRAFDTVRVNAIGLSRVFTGKMSASKSLRGPIGIAQIFGHQFSWIRFWRIVGLLSMVIAFTNLLPIPALDGGHVIFILYEMITGHRPADSVLIRTQQVGMAMLLLLMGYTALNDLYKLFH